MSSLQHAARSGASSLRRLKARPSVREVCLIGELATRDESAAVNPRTSRVHAGRVYRAVEATSRHSDDLRRYWHLSLDNQAVELS